MLAGLSKGGPVLLLNIMKNVFEYKLDSEIRAREGFPEKKTLFP